MDSDERYFAICFGVTLALFGGGLSLLALSTATGAAMLAASPVPILLYYRRHANQSPKPRIIRRLAGSLAERRRKIRCARLSVLWREPIDVWEQFYAEAEEMNRLAPWKQYPDAPVWTEELEARFCSTMDRCALLSGELLRLCLAMLGTPGDEPERQRFALRTAVEAGRWVSFFVAARAGSISGEDAREKTASFDRWLHVRAVRMTRIRRDTGVEQSPRPIEGFTEAPTESDDPRYSGKIDIDFRGRGWAHAFLTRVHEEDDSLATNLHILIPHLRILNHDDAPVTVDRVWLTVNGFPATATKCKPLGPGEIAARSARELDLDCWAELGGFLPQESGAGRCHLVVKTIGLGTHRRLLSAWMFEPTDDFLRVQKTEAEDEARWQHLFS